MPQTAEQPVPDTGDTREPRAESGIDPAPLPLLDTPRDGIPTVINTHAGLERAAKALTAGTGPAAVDAERASGYRYGQRAFLVQIRREGSGTWLIDPEPFDDLQIINQALSGVEWILHAATQDLPCLSELAMWPDRLFDSELAARIAGLPRVGLAAVIKELLGLTLAKEHSAADWSTRPLPEPWLRYATLDVEVLTDVRERLVELLASQSKLDYALQEFEAIRSTPLPATRTDPWRRTSGMHQLRDRRKLAAVRALWAEREQLAKNRDVAPGRLIPDSAIVAAAKSMPSTVPQLLATSGFHGRAAKKDAPRWLLCLNEARTTTDLPALHVPTNAPPPPRVWAEKDSEAAERLYTAKPRLVALSNRLDMPVENLLAPDTLRRIAWRPSKPISPESVAAQLRELGARNWQVELTSAIITVAFLDPDPIPVKATPEE